MPSFLKRMLARALAATAVALCAASPASAAIISADLSRVSGATWDASFTVDADPGQTVDAFSIYFDWTQVSNLVVWGSPTDWDSLAIQADAALGADGLFDALALATGIVSPKALGGFIARFDWADPAGPPAFRFTVNDPVTFALVESGAVSIGMNSPVPEPAMWTLATSALFALALSRLAGGMRPSKKAT